MSLSANNGATSSASPMKKTGLFVLAVLLLAALAAATTRFLRSRENEGGISVSGTIEAVEVNLAFEIPGRVDQILVEEGEVVHKGEVIAHLDVATLQAQHENAQALLAQAQADLLLVTALPLAEQQQAASEAAQLELLVAQQSLQDLVENAALARSEARQALEDAEEALEDLLASEVKPSLALQAIAQAEADLDQAQKKLAILTNPAPQSAIDQAYANMLLAGERRDQTSEDIETAQRKLKNGLGPLYPQEFNEAYKKQLRVAIRNLEIKRSRDQLAYEEAVEKYNQLLEPADPIELALAEAAVNLAEAQLDQRRGEFERVKDGPSQAEIAMLEAGVARARREYLARLEGSDPDELATAQARVAAAEANLSLAESDAIQERVALAQAQVEAARADLNLIQTQLERSVLIAPVNGVVRQRSIEVGEVVNSGDPAITIALLEALHLTVYLPEAYYGILQPSDPVEVTVEAYPGKAFTGRVMAIASESEFLSRHVESPEGEHQAVFAVTILLEETGKLRPGMLAKIEFTGL